MPRPHLRVRPLSPVAAGQVLRLDLKGSKERRVQQSPDRPFGGTHLESHSPLPAPAPASDTVGRRTNPRSATTGPPSRTRHAHGTDNRASDPPCGSTRGVPRVAVGAVARPDRGARYERQSSGYVNTRRDRRGPSQLCATAADRRGSTASIGLLRSPVLDQDHGSRHFLDRSIYQEPLSIGGNLVFPL